MTSRRILKSRTTFAKLPRNWQTKRMLFPLSINCRNCIRNCTIPGPVAKELRDEIGGPLKAASTTVNRRHQQHFEALKEAEQHNLDQKTVICEIIEAIDYSELTNFASWENKTQEIIALQNKWKTIGFAPAKDEREDIGNASAKLMTFSSRRKGNSYKSLKEGMNGNHKKKRNLCEKAEALKDGANWKATADELTKLQKEWKTVGPVAKKYSDAIWKRFVFPPAITSLNRKTRQLPHNVPLNRRIWKRRKPLSRS